MSVDCDLWGNGLEDLRSRVVEVVGGADFEAMLDRHRIDCFLGEEGTGNCRCIGT